MTKLMIPGSWYKKFYFPSGELGVEILPDSIPFGGFKGSLYAEIVTAEDIILLMLLCNALKNIGFNCEELILPYIPFGRQDRHTTYTSAWSLKVFADMINSLGFKNITTYDAHSNVSELLINNLESYNRIGAHAKELKIISSETIIIAPDAGAEKRAYACAKTLGVQRVVVCSKVRDPSTGTIVGIHVPYIMPDKNLLVIDDICDGGATFVELAKQIKTPFKSLTLYVTHGIFSKGRQPLYDAGFTNIVCDFNFIEKRLKND